MTLYNPGDKFNRTEIYAAVFTNMLPSVAFVLLNTPNDFINDFNRYPEAFETVSLIQYPRERIIDLSQSMSNY